MLIPELEQIKHNIVNKPLRPKKIADIIEEAIGEQYGVYVHAYSSKKIAESQMTIAAYFDYEFWDQLDNIELSLIYNPKDFKGLVFDDNSWEVLQFKLYQSLYHEICHRKQYKKRDGLDPYYEKRQNQEGWYFQDPDEIDAHGHDIALELLFYGYSVDEAIDKLKDFTKISLEESITLFAYLVHFKYESGNPSIKQLIKKTIKYLEEKRGA